MPGRFAFSRGLNLELPVVAGETKDRNVQESKEIKRVKCPRPGASLSSRKSCPLFLTTGASLGCGRNCCPHKGRRGTHQFFWRLGITNGTYHRFITKRKNKLLKSVIATCAFVIEHRHSYIRSLHSVNGCFQALVCFWFS